MTLRFSSQGYSTAAPSSESTRLVAWARRSPPYSPTRSRRSPIDIRWRRFWLINWNFIDFYYNFQIIRYAHEYLRHTAADAELTTRLAPQLDALDGVIDELSADEAAVAIRRIQVAN